MPTGYTSKLYDGPQGFRDFALRCARAFGALTMMRDESLDAAIPDTFEPSDYHIKALAKARADLAEVETWDEPEAQRRADTSHERQHADWAKAKASAEERAARYDAMAALVEAWSPPSGDHVNCRAFMLDQLRESKDFDCHVWEEPTRRTGSEFKAERLASLTHDIAYHEREGAAERERAAERTRWVSALRGSLPSE